MSFRRRMMMAAVNSNPQISEYIQDGLAFHLDCADFNSNLGTWIDKVGNVSFAMTDVSVDGAGGVVFNGSSSNGAANIGLNFPIDSSTIEISIKINQSKTQIVLYSAINNTISYGYYNNASNVICSVGTYKLYANTHKLTGFLTHSVCYGNNPITVVDGNIDEFRTSSNRWAYVNGVSTIGKRNDNTNYFNGTIYQIRIYNRHLTAEEMIHNQNIDIQKYKS